MNCTSVNVINIPPNVSSNNQVTLHLHITGDQIGFTSEESIFLTPYRRGQGNRLEEGQVSKLKRKEYQSDLFQQKVDDRFDF